MYRRQQNGKHPLVVPETLIQEFIRENHDSIFVAHPGIQRTYRLISLNYWQPSMRKSIQNYLKKCDSCQRRESTGKFIAPLGEEEEPTFPFQITSVDVMVPIPQHRGKINIYLRSSTTLTSIQKLFLFRTKRPKHVPESMRLKLLLDTAQVQN